MRLNTLWLVCLAFCSVGLRANSTLPAPDPDNGGLNLPPGFQALIVADHLISSEKQQGVSDQLRFLAVAPNGDMYAKTFLGGLIALRDTDNDGRFDEHHEFGSGAGTGVAVHGDWLYYSTNSAVYRYPYKKGQLVPEGEPQLIVGGLTDKGTHNAKTFAFDDQGRLLVEVGSPYNVYSEPDRQFGAKGMDATEFLKTHGGFWRFDPDKPNQTLADGFHFSTGHRHSIALAWQPTSKQFFNAMMGRDNMNIVAPDYYDALDNAERVSEEMHRLREGVNLGWPYTYWDPYKKARMVAPEFGGDNRKRAEVGKYDDPVIAFPGHWAPLQMAFYLGTQFPERYRGGAFIAFHGSWNRAPLPQDGFNIAFVPFDAHGEPVGTYEVFASHKGHRFRMGGVAMANDGSLYVSETDQGRIWRIIYTGNETPESQNVAPSSPSNTPMSPISENKKGQALFEQYCLTCHMADGRGAGQMNPPLQGSKVVSGEAGRLIAVVLRGPAAVLPANRPKYENQMPPFFTLTDAQTSDLLSYVREVFGNKSSAISPADVATARAMK